MILHVARAQDIFYQNSIPEVELLFFNGIDKFGMGIEVCHKKLNPQINLPFKFLIQK